MRLTPRLLLLAVGLFSALRADVTLSPVFQDNAVLQRGRPVPVWGRADPGERVSVAFEQQKVEVATGPDGRWMVQLAPLTARSEPTELTVTGRNTVVVRNVVVGEVWLCSGQSNMEWTVRNSDRPQEEIAAGKFPLIRHFKVARRTSDTPTATVQGDWKEASPETVGDFSAVAYYFARDLHRKLGVPVGLMNSSWGGTPVEAWMSGAALAGDAAFAVVPERWAKTLAEYPERKAAHDRAVQAWTEKQALAEARGEQFTERRPNAPHGPDSPHAPASLYNGMIHPLLPMALRGALWYQGESNAGRASEYHPLFAAMISQWRRDFGQGDFPFYWVQLANFNSGDGAATPWAFLREAQTRTLALPETGQAVAIDIGNPDDIHPRNKQEVGRRLALIATAQVYGLSGDYSGPAFAAAEPGRGAMRVRFHHAVAGLTARDRPLQSFELAGADRVFHPATASIEGETVVVRSPKVPDPVAVRYAWRNSPVANLYNGAGLPAVPFRSDAW
jgi:sialate O-acetylesterase